LARIDVAQFLIERSLDFQRCRSSCKNLRFLVSFMSLSHTKPSVNPPSPLSTSVIHLLAIVRRTATKQSLAQGKAFDPNLGPMADDEAQMPMVEISSGNLHHLTGRYLSG